MIKVYVFLLRVILKEAVCWLLAVIELRSPPPPPYFEVFSLNLMQKKKEKSNYTIRQEMWSLRTNSERKISASFEWKYFRRYLSPCIPQFFLLCYLSRPSRRAFNLIMIQCLPVIMFLPKEEVLSLTEIKVPWSIELLKRNCKINDITSDGLMTLKRNPFKIIFFC